MSTSLWTTVRDDLRERREARAAHRRLQADLAVYRTPAEIDDLLAAVDGHEGTEAEQIRSILADNLAAWHARNPRSRAAGF